MSLVYCSSSRIFYIHVNTEFIYYFPIQISINDSLHSIQLNAQAYNL